MLNALINLTMASFFEDERESVSREGPQPSFHRARSGKGTRGGSRFVDSGVSVSHSHMSLYLRTGGAIFCFYNYIIVNINRLIILQSLH